MIKIYSFLLKRSSLVSWNKVKVGVIGPCFYECFNCNRQCAIIVLLNITKDNKVQSFQGGKSGNKISLKLFVSTPFILRAPLITTQPYLHIRCYHVQKPDKRRPTVWRFTWPWWRLLFRRYEKFLFLSSYNTRYTVHSAVISRYNVFFS